MLSAAFRQIEGHEHPIAYKYTFCQLIFTQLVFLYIAPQSRKLKKMKAQKEGAERYSILPSPGNEGMGGDRGRRDVKALIKLN
jgi:hypothetical protein